MENDLRLEIRRQLSLLEEIAWDAGQPLKATKRIAVGAVVISNPFSGRFEQELGPWIRVACAPLGELVRDLTLAMLPEGVEVYGKAAVVGIGGDVEVGSAIIHNLRFGDPLRDAVRGSSLLPAVEKVAAPGMPIDIPLKHILDDKTRSHHQTVTVQWPDVPLPDEILIALAVSDSGRPRARIGSFGSQEAS